MSNELLPNSINKRFEEYKKTDSDKVEYWDARELMPLLGYTDWKNFKKVILKAHEACKNSKQTIENHFSEVGKMIIIASGTPRETTRNHAGTTRTRKAH